MSRRRNPHPYRVVVTRYQDARGRRCRKDAPGARKVSERTDSWYADLPGAPRTPLGVTDEALAWAELRRRLKERHELALGIRDEYSGHASRPLPEHLADWMEVLRAKGTSEKQRGQVLSRLLRLFALAGWERLPQMTADSAQVALAAIQRDKGRGGKPGRSAATRNHYLGHLKGFCAWLVDSGRARANPVRQLRPVNAEADRRHERRCPTSEEVAALAAWLLSDAAPVREGMSGRQRLLGYEVSMATGLRANELRSLGRPSFDLDAGTVTLRAGADKRRRGAAQPLPPWLVTELREWFDAGGGCWEAFPAVYPGRLLRQDLDGAGLAYRVEGPDGALYWDMHSLRVWYVSALANDPTVSVKTLMELARHSTPRLSLQVYARSRPEDRQRAVDRLPPPSGAQEERPD